MEHAEGLEPKRLIDRTTAELIIRARDRETRPHEASAWNRPNQVHLGLADPTIPTFQATETLPYS